MKQNNFNPIAPYYDRLTRLVFGKKLINAQVKAINHLETSMKVLIVGGGSGGLLPELPKGIKVNYVEASAQMLALAKQQKSPAKITFIHQDILNHSGSYDCVIAPFFLDCFNEKGLKFVLQHFQKLIRNGGKLIVTDFQPPKNISQKWLLRSMHFFFRLTAKLQSKGLQDIDLVTQTHGFKLLEKTVFTHPAIYTSIYIKTN